MKAVDGKNTKEKIVFKNRMMEYRYWNGIGKLVLFLLLFVTIGKTVDYLSVDDTKSYTRLTFHEFYNQDKIDILFVGGSVCYRYFVPDIIDDKLGLKSFNVGTSSQPIDGSLAIIKEAVARYKMKEIYFVTSTPQTTDFNERTLMTPITIISDYMKLSLNKIQFIINASSMDYYVNNFIRSRRESEHIFDIGRMKSILEAKADAGYKKYEYLDFCKEYYAGRGYVASNEAVSSLVSENLNNVEFDESCISDDWLDSWNEIVDICNKNHVKLIVVSSPQMDYLWYPMGNYDKYIEFFEKLCDEAGVEYWNFNILKAEYGMRKTSLYKDEGHVNKYGAELFTNILCDLISGKENKKDLFYTSYQDKIENIPPEVFGIHYTQDNYEGMFDLQIVTNAAEEEITWNAVDYYEENGRMIENMKFRGTETEFQIPFETERHGEIKLITYIGGREKSDVSIHY